MAGCCGVSATQNLIFFQNFIIRRKRFYLKLKIEKDCDKLYIYCKLYLLLLLFGMDISEKISFDKINNNFDNGAIFFLLLFYNYLRI